MGSIGCLIEKTRSKALVPHGMYRALAMLYMLEIHKFGPQGARKFLWSMKTYTNSLSCMRAATTTVQTSLGLGYYNSSNE